MIMQNHQAQPYKYRFFIFLSTFLFFIYPIVHANFFHIDDLGRSLSGYYGWTSVGRPLATFMYKVLTLNFKNAIDISPLSQIIGIAVLASACASVATLDQFNEYTSMLPLAFLGISPFMVANYSYRFDSLFMPIAIAFAIIPYYFYYRFGTYTSIILASLSLFAAYNLYQPAINDYLELFILFSVSFLLGFKRNISLTISAISFLLGSALYKMELIFTSIVPKTGFPGLHASIVLSKNIIERNFISVLKILWHTTKDYPEKLVFLVIALFLAIGVVVFFKKMRNYFFSLVVLCAGIPMIFGPMLLLKNPIYESIVFIGFGGFLTTASWLAMFVFSKISKNSYAKVFLFFLMAYPQMIIAYVYGNAQYSQKQFINTIGHDIDERIYKITNGRQFYLGIYGAVPIAQRSMIASNEYNIVSRSLDRPINWHWYWGKVFLQTYYNINIKHRISAKDVTKIINNCNLNGYQKYYFMYYNIYYNKFDDTLLIDFSKKCR